MRVAVAAAVSSTQGSCPLMIPLGGHLRKDKNQEEQSHCQTQLCTALAWQGCHLLLPHPGAAQGAEAAMTGTCPHSPGPFQHSLQGFLQHRSAPVQDSSQAAPVSWADLGWRQQQLRALPCQEPTWELWVGPQELQEQPWLGSPGSGTP